MTDDLMKDLDQMYDEIKKHQSYLRDINNLEILVHEFRTKEGIRNIINDIDQIVKKKLAERGHLESITELSIAYELYRLSKTSREHSNQYKDDNKLRTVFDGLSRTTRLMCLAYLSRYNENRS